MSFITNEDFKKGICEFAERHNLSKSELARRLGRSRETVTFWSNHGVKTDSAREEIASKYPHIFFSGNFVARPVGEGSENLTDFLESCESKDQKVSPLSMIKIAIADDHITALAKVFNWFVFTANASEREQFRKDVGEDWKKFQSLVRALTSEIALAVTLDEGKL